MSLIQLIVERGVDAIDELPEGTRKSNEAVAETIEKNVRRLITGKSSINPKYYEKMSELLDSFIFERRANAIGYKAYLKKIVDLTKKANDPTIGKRYPE